MRTILIVLDSVGCGALPDAAIYGDQTANTLAHVAEAVGGLQIPQLRQLGLGNILPLAGGAAVASPSAAYGKMAEVSPGKDTITGHWEMAGLRLVQPFAVYPGGFPAELIQRLEAAIGRKTLGNIAASGTEIIEQLGPEHQKTGYPIVYTSADSVLQIAVHLETVPLAQLYAWCEIARRLCRGNYEVARIIARPFVGSPGAYIRTADRHDYPINPGGNHLLTLLQERGIPVYAVGKIADVFCNEGVTASYKTKDNLDGMQKTEKLLLEKREDCFIFTNLVEFDSLYGHRNNPGGYAGALEEFDRFLPRLLQNLQPEDWLIITADHGCDPTDTSTDHNREYVPLLIYGPHVRPGSLETRTSFADLGTTIAYRYGCTMPLHGTLIPVQSRK
ncbi:MAG: phosphopentomutase [Negativicutes bacterium]|nr:phosphopentomutase [Negativicutes bacterium]